MSDDATVLKGGSPDQGEPSRLLEPPRRFSIVAWQQPMGRRTLSNLDVTPQTLRLWQAFSGLDMTVRRQALVQGEVIPVGADPKRLPEDQLAVAISGRIAVHKPGGISGEEVLKPGQLLISGGSLDLAGLIPSEVFVVDQTTWTEIAGEAGQTFLMRGLRDRCDRLERLVSCVGRHSLTARLADILVYVGPSSDRMSVPLAQSQLAKLLAVQRTTVNKASSELVRAGLTRTIRNQIKILDLDGLKGISCGCRTIAKPSRFSVTSTTQPAWAESIIGQTA